MLPRPSASWMLAGIRTAADMDLGSAFHPAGQDGARQADDGQARGCECTAVHGFEGSQGNRHDMTTSLDVVMPFYAFCAEVGEMIYTQCLGKNDTLNSEENKSAPCDYAKLL